MINTPDNQESVLSRPKRSIRGRIAGVLALTAALTACGSNRNETDSQVRDNTVESAEGKDLAWRVENEVVHLTDDARNCINRVHESAVTPVERQQGLSACPPYKGAATLNEIDPTSERMRLFIQETMSDPELQLAAVQKAEHIDLYDTFPQISTTEGQLEALTKLTVGVGLTSIPIQKPKTYEDLSRVNFIFTHAYGADAINKVLQMAEFDSLDEFERLWQKAKGYVTKRSKETGDPEFFFEWDVENDCGRDVVQQ